MFWLAWSLFSLSPSLLAYHMVGFLELLRLLPVITLWVFLLMNIARVVVGRDWHKWSVPQKLDPVQQNLHRNEKAKPGWKTLSHSDLCSQCWQTYRRASGKIENDLFHQLTNHQPQAKDRRAYPNYPSKPGGVHHTRLWLVSQIHPLFIV